MTTSSRGRFNEEARERRYASANAVSEANWEAVRDESMVTSNSTNERGSGVGVGVTDGVDPLVIVVDGVGVPDRD